eukprot:g1454.t1
MLFKVDPFARKAYTKEEFLQHYDDLKEWDSLDYLDTSAFEGDLCSLGKQNLKEIFDLFDYEENGKLGQVGAIRLATLVVGKNINVAPDVNGDVTFPAFFEWTRRPDLKRIVEDDSKSEKLYDGEKIYPVISFVKEKVNEKGTSTLRSEVDRKAVEEPKVVEALAKRAEEGAKSATTTGKELMVKQAATATEITTKEKTDSESEKQVAVALAKKAEKVGRAAATKKGTQERFVDSKVEVFYLNEDTSSDEESFYLNENSIRGEQIEYNKPTMEELNEDTAIKESIQLAEASKRAVVELQNEHDAMQKRIEEYESKMNRMKRESLSQNEMTDKAIEDMKNEMADRLHKEQEAMQAQVQKTRDELAQAKNTAEEASKKSEQELLETKTNA